MESEVELEDKEEPEFYYDDDWERMEGNYMWLRFKIKRLLSTRDYWDDVTLSNGET